MVAGEIDLVGNSLLRKFGYVIPRGVDLSAVVSRLTADSREVPSSAKLLIVTHASKGLTELGFAVARQEADSFDLELNGIQPIRVERPRFMLRNRDVPDGAKIGPVTGETEYDPLKGEPLACGIFEKWPAGLQPFAWIQPGEERKVVGVRGRERIVIGVDLIEFVKHSLTWIPLDRGLSRRVGSGGFGAAEILLRRLLLDALAISGTPIAKIDPWPEGKKWAFSIRQDYDRLITDDQLRRLLRVYREAGVRSSWYILSHKRITHQIKMVHDAGHEIGHHTTADSALEFARQIADLQVVTGCPIEGVTAHGGDYIGFLGGNQWDWACQSNLCYTETQGYMHDRPYYVLREDGAPLIGLPTHHSLDLGTQPEKHALERCVTVAERARAAGAGFLVMNHPDIHFPQMVELLDRVPRDTAWLATSYDLARWALLNAQAILDLKGGKATLSLPFASPWSFHLKLPGVKDGTDVMVVPADTAVSGAA